MGCDAICVRADWSGPATLDNGLVCPSPEQGRWLASVIRGHEAYYAVPGNAEAGGAFRYYVTRHWRFALSRRSQRSRVTWERMSRLARRYLPTTKIRHPWPEARFAARHP
jgi:RNA-directed DNA polymerase